VVAEVDAQTLAGKNGSELPPVDGLFGFDHATRLLHTANKQGERLSSAYRNPDTYAFNVEWRRTNGGKVLYDRSLGTPLVERAVYASELVAAFHRHDETLNVEYGRLRNRQPYPSRQKYLERMRVAFPNAADYAQVVAPLQPAE